MADMVLSVVLFRATSLPAGPWIVLVRNASFVSRCRLPGDFARRGLRGPYRPAQQPHRLVPAGDRIGQLLMMIDVTRDRVKEIEGVVTGSHPEAAL